jgi:large subunit ribosomal protein L15
MDLGDRQGLHNLVAPKGARRNKKRVGRGRGSGMGKTSGRGMKGQKARKSGGVRPGFEGGQLPLARRQPKRGFRNALFRNPYTVVNVGLLAERFAAGSTVDVPALVADGLLAKPTLKIKILGEGDIGHALTLRVHKVSASAREKIEKAGGSIELLEAPKGAAKAAKASESSEG